MEPDDLTLIEKVVQENHELKQLMQEHNDYEKRIEEFNRKSYLSSEEAFERKRLQKLKLAGRDRIERILSEYRMRDS